MKEQLEKLAAQIPKQFISQIPSPGGGTADYVDHAVIRQLLLWIVGPYDWHVTQPFSSGNDREPVALVGTLTVTIDGRQTTVDGVGQGSDAKSAESDALKRAAMNTGVNLELWGQDKYFLDKQLKKDREAGDD